MNEWLLIALMALVTYLPRALPLAFAGRVRLPAALERGLEFVPIAVLTAIIAQTALVRDGALDLSLHNHHALADQNLIAPQQSGKACDPRLDGCHALLLFLTFFFPADEAAVRSPEVRG